MESAAEEAAVEGRYMGRSDDELANEGEDVICVGNASMYVTVSVAESLHIR